MLVITCPLCRERCSLCEVTFALLMKEHRPDGTMLMDFLGTKAGFCLAVQRATAGKWVADPTLYFLEAAQYLRHLENHSSDEWCTNSLFNELSNRSRTRSTAAALLAETPGGATPIRLMTDELVMLAALGRALGEEGDGENVEDPAAQPA
jgi:hypothetical protein